MNRFRILALVLLFSTPMLSQSDSEYSQKLQQLFEVSGTEETYKMAIKQMFIIFKQEYSDVEPETWTEFEKEFNQTSLKELTKMLVPVYSKYLTKEDLEELINFYETPAGKKYAKSNPLIMQESMQIGQEWGRKVGEQFAEKMQAKGYE